LGLLLIVSGVIASALASAMGETASFAQTAFVLLALPGFILELFGAVGREPAVGDTRWYCRPSMTLVYRLGGILVLIATIWLALHV
ncbi:MAG: hypothetical protein WCN98_21050, partial [Verrucomicrobiaceae bacterium]